MCLLCELFPESTRMHRETLRPYLIQRRQYADRCLHRNPQRPRGSADAGLI